MIWIYQKKNWKKISKFKIGENFTWKSIFRMGRFSRLYINTYFSCWKKIECYENFRNVIISINCSVLSNTRIKFSSWIDNILYCQFLNFRSGTTGKLGWNCANFFNHLLPFTSLFTTVWCVLISMTPKFRGKHKKSALPLKLTYCVT